MCDDIVTRHNERKDILTRQRGNINISSPLYRTIGVSERLAQCVVSNNILAGEAG